MDYAVRIPEQVKKYISSFPVSNIFVRVYIVVLEKKF